jgi:modulator of FtsH protease
LLFGIHKMRDSLWSLPMVFALTGFMGYTLGPVLSRYAAVPGGSETIAMALGLTGVTFIAMSAYAIQTRRDFSFLGGFLLAGMVIAMLAGLAGMFFNIPALSLAVSAAVALLSAGLILFETSNIVNGGETSPVMATVSLFVSIFNLFTSLLSLLGIGSSED